MIMLPLVGALGDSSSALQPRIGWLHQEHILTHISSQLREFYGGNYMFRGNSNLVRGAREMQRREVGETTRMTRISIICVRNVSVC